MARRLGRAFGFKGGKARSHFIRPNCWAIDALRRVQREIEARQRRQDQERRATAESLLNHLCEQSDALVRAALIVGGYHQHDRGVWRRKRERDHSTSEI